MRFVSLILIASMVCVAAGRFSDNHHTGVHRQAAAMSVDTRMDYSNHEGCCCEAVNECCREAVNECCREAVNETHRETDSGRQGERHGGNACDGQDKTHRETDSGRQGERHGGNACDGQDQTHRETDSGRQGERHGGNACDGQDPCHDEAGCDCSCCSHSIAFEFHFHNMASVAPEVHYYTDYTNSYFFEFFVPVFEPPRSGLLN